MKNNETFQTTQHLDKLVTNLGPSYTHPQLSIPEFAYIK